VTRQPGLIESHVELAWKAPRQALVNDVGSRGTGVRLMRSCTKKNSGWERSNSRFERTTFAFAIVAAQA
jgi:hypothetical protein